jgi:type IV pilus modification protein PilV
MDSTLPSTTRKISRNDMARQMGFNLVEVLVALLVLAVGLLGMAALQNFSLASTQQSYQRTQATVVIQDIVEKMRANRIGAINALYSIPSYTRTPPSAAVNCATSNCSESDLALYDMNTWMTYLTNDQVMGPTAQAQITVLQNLTRPSGLPVGARYQIGVRWIEGDLTMTQTMTVEAP